MLACRTCHHLACSLAHAVTPLGRLRPHREDAAAALGPRLSMLADAVGNRPSVETCELKRLVKAEIGPAVRMYTRVNVF